MSKIFKKIKSKFDSKKTEEVKPYLEKGYVVGTISVIVKNESGGYDKLYCGTLVGEKIEFFDTTYLFDALSPKNERYEIIDGDDKIKELLKNDQMPLNKPFCSSLYKKEQLPISEIFNMLTKEEIIDYLYKYNVENNIALYWTCFSDEQKEVIDRIVKTNKSTHYID